MDAETASAANSFPLVKTLTILAQQETGAVDAAELSVRDRPHRDKLVLMRRQTFASALQHLPSLDDLRLEYCVGCGHHCADRGMRPGVLSNPGNTICRLYAMDPALRRIVLFCRHHNVTTYVTISEDQRERLQADA